jgi:general secretion pathway protein L
MAGTVSAAFETFWLWWTQELKGLLPRSAFAVRSRAARRLIIAVDGQRKELLLEKGAHRQPLSETGSGTDWLVPLADAIRSRPDLPVGLRFGGADCFSRTVQLPAQAKGDFGRILDLDMERSTPFRASDVLTAFHVVPDAAAPRGKHAVRHLVIKRKTIAPLLEDMRIAGVEPVFADCWDEARSGGLPVNFLASLQPPMAASPSRRNWIAAILTLLTVSAVAIPIARHRAALRTLEARTEVARAEAASVRLAMEASQTAAAQIEALERRLRGRLPVARIVEELTAIMPDSAWVSDLRIEQDTVEFTGFAKSAAALIPALEASALFADAALTSPVVLDTAEDKERFSARLRLSFADMMPNADEAAAEQEAAAQ